MAFTANSQVSVGYIAETVPGTTPVSPAFKNFRVIAEELEITRDVAFSPELNGYRGEVGGVQVYGEAKGPIKFQYSHSMLDDMLTSLLRNAWSNNSITDGQTAQTFSIQTEYNTGATQTYKRVNGAQIDKMQLNLKPAAIVEGVLDIMGMAGTYNTTAIVGATSVNAASEPVIAGPSIGSIAFGGFSFDYLTQADILIANNLKPRKALGNLGPFDFGAGKLEVTGSLEFYLNNDELSILTAFLGSTGTSIALTVGTVVGKRLNISIPNAQLQQAKTVSASKDGDVMISCKFKAAQSAFTGGNVITITRNN